MGKGLPEEANTSIPPPGSPYRNHKALKRPPIHEKYLKFNYKMNQNDSNPIQTTRTRNSLLVLACVFLSALLLMTFVYRTFPKLQPEDAAQIKLPKDLEDAKILGKVLSKYNQQYFFKVMLGFFTTYIFLQTFAIPGSIFLSILSGFLFPFPLALFLVCLCSAIGASNCYMLSYLVGRPLVLKYIPNRVADWAKMVDQQRDYLLNYIIFLRITPFLPNWFINITSPVLNVSLTPFFLGTFLGVAPPSFVAIQAGTTLYQLTHYGDAMSTKSIVVLAAMAILSILPVVFKERMKKKYATD